MAEQSAQTPRTEVELQQSHIPSAIPFQSRFDNIKKINGFHISSFGLAGERDGLKALNLESFDLVTIEVLRVHVFKILLTVMITTSNFLQRIWELFNKIFDFFRILLFQLIILNSFTRKRSNLRFGKHILDIYYSTSNYITNFPKVSHTLFDSKVLCYNISGLTDFKSQIPMKYIPNSIALILRVNILLLSSPPPIPQPYLNANKELLVPSKKQIQNAISLRNEYITQNRTHIAAEKVRLSIQIGKFIVWNILQPNISNINVYEEMGILWNDKLTSIDEKLVLLSNSILNELHSFVGICSTSEFNDLLTLLPSEIILKELFSSKTLIIDKIIDAKIVNKRQVRISFTDSRLNSKPLTGDSESIYTEIEKTFPVNSDLTLVPGKDGIKQSSLLGYTALNHSSIIHFSTLEFGFKFYTQGLFTYALVTKKDDGEIENIKSLVSLLSLSKINSAFSNLIKSLRPRESVKTPVVMTPQRSSNVEEPEVTYNFEESDENDIEVNLPISEIIV